MNEERKAAAATARGIDPQLGLVEGEGALQHVQQRPEQEHPLGANLARLGLGGAPSRDSYYGLPMLKEPVWIWAVPAYFYVGGVAGAAATLGAAAQ
ncbi:MAG: hypothetical protein ACK4N5_24670, partial [Myxococcales bacterium]